MAKTEQPPKKRFSQALLTLARTNNIATIFDDFLDFALLFIKWWERKPEEYLELDKRYPEPEQAHLMVEAYLAMGDIAENGGEGFKDPFGDFFEEYMSSSRTGQFFTPQPVCDFMAQIQMPADVPNHAKVNDPCCGSGRLLLSAAKINRHLQFFATDVDLTCCKMTVLNFLLNTMCGEVTWGDTIRLTNWKTWHVRKILDADGYYVPYYAVTEGQRSEYATPTPDQPLLSSNELTSNVAPSKRTRGPKSNLQLVIDFDLK